MWLKVKVWTKITLLSVISLYLLFFVIFNVGKKASLWFWYHTEPETPLLLLVLLSFMLGALLTMLLRTIRTTIAQVRAMKQRNLVENQQRELDSLRIKAAALNTTTVRTVAVEDLPPTL